LRENRVKEARKAGGVSRSQLHFPYLTLIGRVGN